MKELLWNKRVVMISLLFVVLSASSATAQRPSADHAREPVSTTSGFGDRMTPAKPRERDEDEQPGMVMAVARPRVYETQRARVLRRNHRIKVIKAERPQRREPIFRAESLGGLELALEPSDEVEVFGERTSPSVVEVSEDDNKPGVEVAPAHNPEPKRFRRDPKIRVMKGNRP